MAEIKDVGSAANFVANQGIGRFGIIGSAIAHLLIAGYQQPSLELVACIVGKHGFPSEFLRFA